jgi:hypothetical protein
MNFFVYISVLALAALTGCATTEKVELSAGPNQQAIVKDGVPALISPKRHLVMLRPNNRLIKRGSRPAFTLVVKNQGSVPQTLLESSISASQSIDGKVVAVRVHRYDELVEEEQTRQTIAAVGTALSAFGRAMSAADAGYSHTTGTFNTYGSNTGNTYGTYSATTYDPARAQLAQQAASAQTNREISELRSQGEQNLQRLQQTILKDNTVMPGEWYGGSIVLDPPDIAESGATTYSIVVIFAGEQHTFSVSHTES